MTNDEKKLFLKNRRAIGFLLLVIFCLVPYIESLIDEAEDEKFQKEVALISLGQKNEHISKLYKVIDSLKKIEKTPIIIEVPRKKKKPTKDSISNLIDTTITKTFIDSTNKVDSL